ncbi:Asp-tRNA(Asn)/Glu-tRNA(Gln) amidotransferase subunit GatC [Wolbachia endosymbiont of Pentidionis agamae]|uniref:Asp-tRNA(Asn)/Glu-tRNA(Gln) amidotransferase subunit GatC n=1 Tax=Wolbachia endosymbiont of Pentidionis agamae TaxID=3110435 RepID=UPI002FD77F43
MSNKSTADIISSLVEFVSKRQVTISKDEMTKIVKLVRIKLSDDEFKHYSKELSMLDWIRDTLSHVNTKDVLPVRYGSIDSDEYIRHDVIDCEDKEDKILLNTESENGYFIVPKVVND